MKLKENSYLSSSNAVFIEELYNKYTQDPNSVDDSWRRYFANLGDNPKDIASSVIGAAWRPNGSRVIGVVDKLDTLSRRKEVSVVSQPGNDEIALSIKVANLISSYMAYGHMSVELDPLGLNKPKYHPELDYRHHNIGEKDLDKCVLIEKNFNIEKVVLRDLLNSLNANYSGRIAYEFTHIESPEERAWFKNKIEQTEAVRLSKEEKLKALQDILEAEMFENFTHIKFPGTKRFSIEGGENAISALETVISSSLQLGIKEVILGMAHRGRLNTLTKVIGKPYHAMFSEFKGELAYPDNMGIPGDVKYHLGSSSDRVINGHNVHLSLTPNPSHLEVVNSIVLGKVRAKQDQRKDLGREVVLGVLIHGDAAFAGQGSVMEALSLSQLHAYHTGGTIHIVINNQIGFTTNPSQARSTIYSTDIGKFISVPILHVNGDDAEATVYASKIVAEYRDKFKKDVILDIVCYRKYGHNEGDEPFFTQPLMYENIKNKKNPPEVFAEKLIQEGVMTAQEFEQRKRDFRAVLDEAFIKAETFKAKKADWLEGKWSDFELAQVDRDEEKTGVNAKLIKEVGNKLSEVPSQFNINPKIGRLLEAKRQMIETGKDIDWGTGEALALGTLLLDGFKVRITGQDVERGTFSHRHAVLFDQKDETKFIPLNNIASSQKSFLEVSNSNLSEFAVLGFEYGYSITDPMCLTMWEAQFGDFVNGAQVIVDQYISSGEAKWLRMSGLVMLLPHGYEGQGPEHSSARLERFLQLCAKDNMQVVNCTTPASYFHVLRRQMHRNFRKPLVVMSPKSLLRHKLAVSKLEEMTLGTSFQPVINEVNDIASNDKVRRVVVCSGKVYYDLYERREELKIKDTAIVRMEQLYPFPAKYLANELAKYKKAEIVWCQEEHENMGAFYFVEPRIEKVLNSINHACKRARYIGRERAASPAVGYMKLHVSELKKILEDVFK